MSIKTSDKQCFVIFGRMSIKTSDNHDLFWKDVYKDKRQANFFFFGRMSKKTSDNHVLFFGRMSLKRQGIIKFLFFGRMSIKTSDNHDLFFGRMSIKTSDKQCFSSLEGCLKRQVIIMFYSLEECL